MDIVTGLLVIVILYCVLLFFDTFFKTCAHYPYIQFLEGTGLKVKVFYLQWTTTAFNRILLRWGSNHIKFLNLWFTLGLYTTLVLLPIAVFLILFALVQILFQNVNEASHNIIIEPVIPGVNLPVSELGYYTVTLAFCSVVHEAGHALAAVKEDVHLVNVGISVLFVIPVAYVNLSNDKLQSLNPKRLLKILCAGVWHNLVLAFVAYLLYLVAPHFFSCFYYVNNGLYVTSLEAHSPLLGPRGLEIGDIITKVDDCNALDEASWTECLLQARRYKLGFCVDTDTAHELDESVPIKQLSNGAYECCGPRKPDWLCFEYTGNKEGALELPPHMCLPARTIIENHKFFCNIKSQTCPNDLHCIYPLLPNNTMLVKIQRIQKSVVIYVGHPLDVLHTTQISPFIPKRIFSTTAFPDTVMKLLRYIILFSIGLALVNVIPCIYMDGQHITNAIAQILFADRALSKLVSTILTLFGTMLFIFHCVYTIWTRLLK